jgi:hypothetical protein
LAVLAPATRAVPPEETLVRAEIFVDAAPVVPRAVALLAVATSARAERAVPPATSPELRLRDAEAEAAPEARVASRARVPPPLPVASLGGGRRTSSDIVARACVVWASRSARQEVNHDKSTTRNAFGFYRLRRALRVKRPRQNNSVTVWVKFEDYMLCGVFGICHSGVTRE